MTENTTRSYDEEKNMLDAMLASLAYNRDPDDLLPVLIELAKRIDGLGSFVDWSDDANIIYGALVYRYGDYGTSPRSGWFYDKELVKALGEIVQKNIYLCKVEIKEANITNV